MLYHVQQMYSVMLSIVSSRYFQGSSCLSACDCQSFEYSGLFCSAVIEFSFFIL